MFSKTVTDPREASNEFYHMSVTTLGELNYRQANLENDISINASILEQEKLGQAVKFLWWRRALTAAKDKMKRARDARKRVWSKLADQKREVAKTLQDKNPSKEVIEDYILQNPEYIKAHEAYRDASKVYDDLESVVESLRQRFEILKNLKFEDIKHLRK